MRDQLLIDSFNDVECQWSENEQDDNNDEECNLISAKGYYKQIIQYIELVY